MSTTTLSKLTSQGQVSVPMDIRRKMGIGPGSILEWREEGDQIVVSRAGRFTSEDIHKTLFSRAPKAHSLDELREGIRQSVRKRHAQR